MPVIYLKKRKKSLIKRKEHIWEVSKHAKEKFSKSGIHAGQIVSW